MSGETKRVGNWGEALTAEYLRGKGYHILDSGFRCQEGEIDLIAQKGDTLAFVEVKTRQSAHYGAGREAVDRRKQRKITATAFHYLAQHPDLPHKIRFDVADILAPQGVQTQRPALRYLENAFAYDPSNLTEPGGS
mgnify:FL=1